jgi:hypothetical protein
MYLSDYLEAGNKAIYKKYGVFFAFGTEQLNEGLKINLDKGITIEGDKTTKFPLGMFAPTKHKESVLKELDSNFDKAVKEDIKANGKEKIIVRELYNYECFYTGDIHDALSKVSVYGYTLQDVEKAYIKEYPTYCKHNE